MWAADALFLCGSWASCYVLYVSLLAIRLPFFNKLELSWVDKDGWNSLQMKLMWLICSSRAIAASWSWLAFDVCCRRQFLGNRWILIVAPLSVGFYWSTPALWPPRDGCRRARLVDWPSPASYDLVVSRTSSPASIYFPLGISYAMTLSIYLACCRKRLGINRLFTEFTEIALLNTGHTLPTLQIVNAY